MHKAPDDDDTIPPPGRRAGEGADSILPFLARSLAVKPQTQPDAVTPVTRSDGVHGQRDRAPTKVPRPPSS